MSIMQYYIDNKIPKVRWMYPGKAYKARLITVPRHYEEAKMFVYVLDDKYLIAYRDEALTREIGMMKLEHFELFGHLNISEPPTYSSRMPISLTYGQLLEPVIETAESAKEPVNVTEKVKIVPIEVDVKVEPEVKVIILPPDPPVEFEQMELALF